MAWSKKLCGLAEAAKVLGVSDTRVGQFSAKDPTFPQPLDTLSCGRIWLHADIEDYAERRELLLAARSAAKEVHDGTQQLPGVQQVPEVVPGSHLVQP